MGAGPAGPLIHIGFPKCASTFLQQSVFTQLPGVYTRPDWLNLVFDRFVLTDSGDFDPREAAAVFTPAGDDGSRVPVLSNENLVGGAAARYDWLVPTADRLVAAFPDAKVVMVVREQRSMVLSLYRQLVKRGEHLRLRDAISPLDRAGYYPRLRTERLRYHLPHQVYLDRVGPDRLLVLPFELLMRDDRAFVAQIAEFATGRPPRSTTVDRERENVGYRGLTLEMRRRMNAVAAENYTGPGGPHWSYKAARRATGVVDRLLPDSSHPRWEATYREIIAEVVGDRFAESNRLLAEQTGLDLGALGYAV